MCKTSLNTFRLEDLKRTLASELKKGTSLRENETVARLKFDLVSAQHSGKRGKNSDLRKLVDTYRETINALGGVAKPLPECKALKKQVCIVNDKELKK